MTLRFAALSAALLLTTAPAMATTFLGDAATFAVLSGATTTNIGATTINGDIAVYPGTSTTGLETVTLTGTAYPTGAVGLDAQTAARAAYTALFALTPTRDLTGLDLGGLTLTPGVYSFASAAGLTGTLTLDYGATPDAAFVFQVGTALTTAGASLVNVLNAGSNSGIYWGIGNSATLGATTSFVGNILADQSVTLTTGASLCGRAIALGASVSLDSNGISTSCTGTTAGSFTLADDSGSRGYSGTALTSATPVPEPASWALLIVGFMGVGAVLRRERRSEGFSGRAIARSVRA